TPPAMTSRSWPSGWPPRPGYHMSKKHWNTLVMDGSLPEKMILKWVDDSYDLVVASLPKKLREELSNL
ncbi:MAG TPA: MmcQ/YjbR family DNA-binding protein, partial [Flavobacteriales bacterium]|nr:MmcQ/YjbR family DNA-binding protein [Flavobacteriales bacterium]